MPTSSTWEAVGVFQSEHALQLAADELLISGFDRADLSLLADARTVEQKLGHAYRCMTEIEDDPTVPKQAYAGSDSRTEAEGAIASGLMYVGLSARWARSSLLAEASPPRSSGRL